MRALYRDRAVSPVIGVVLLTAVVVSLAAVAGAMFLGLAEDPEPVPEADLSLEQREAPGAVAVVHRNGDELSGGEVAFRGAADPDGLEGGSLTAGRSHSLLAVDSTIRVVWLGESGTTHLVEEFEVDPDETVPEPDEGCGWVDSESDGGTEDVEIDGFVVDCDTATDKVIEVSGGGVVIGDTRSDDKEVDGDDAAFYGDVTVEKTVNLQHSSAFGAVESGETAKIDDSTVGGSVTGGTAVEVIDGSSVGGDTVSDTKGVKVVASDVAGAVSAGENAKIDGGSVGGSVDAQKTLEVIDGGSVGGDVTTDGSAAIDGGTVAGDVVSGDDQVKVLSGTVSGSIATDGSVKLDGATVEGDVYVDGGDFDCTDSTIDGEPCGEYAPEAPDDY